jgi:hypothetical protein
MTSKPATGFDLSTLASERKPFELELLHPGTKRGLGLFLTLISINEPAPKKITSRVNTDAQKLIRKNTNFTADQQRENAIAILTACTTGWRWGEDADGNTANWNGEQLDFTPANLRKVLLVDELRDQVDTEVADNSNFFRN